MPYRPESDLKAIIDGLENSETNPAIADVGAALRALGPVIVPALANQVAAFIVDAIRSGIFPLGSLLPAERVLAEGLNVSRKVVRDALEVLRGYGIIEVTRGRFGGSTVVSLDGVSSLLREIYDGKVETLRDLHQVRRVLEREACVSAARHLTDDNYANLVEILDKAEQAFGNFLLYQEYTVQFHVRVGLYSLNPILAGMVRAVANQISIAGQSTPSINDMSMIVENQSILRDLLAAMRNQDFARIEVIVDRHIDLILSRLPS